MIKLYTNLRILYFTFLPAVLRDEYYFLYTGTLTLV